MKKGYKKTVCPDGKYFHQGVKGTVTNALASAFVGSLGGGKSFCNNLLVYYSVLFGGQAVILDPKSERGNWKETLPEIAEEINIVNLTSDKENAGLLDPFVIMKDKEDGATLAKEILTFLTGISTRDGDKFPVLISAISKVSESEQRGLLNVITELRKEIRLFQTTLQIILTVLQIMILHTCSFQTEQRKILSVWITSSTSYRLRIWFCRIKILLLTNTRPLNYYRWQC